MNSYNKTSETKSGNIQIKKTGVRVGGKNKRHI
jgi:hypothetical protein